jgi:hypothetical protein
MVHMRVWMMMLVVVAGFAMAACDSSTPAAREALDWREPPTATPTATPRPPTQTPTVPPTATPTATATRQQPPPTPYVPTPPPTPPTVGRWIDVDTTRFVVRLMDGQAAMMTIAPVAVGEQVDTGIYNSTATGLFHVYSKTAALTYDAPYDTYISNWVGFDPRLDNGFHSFLQNEQGQVVDASTGRVSNGCIRTGASDAIYAFAEIGMAVFVHA